MYVDMNGLLSFSLFNCVSSFPRHDEFHQCRLNSIQASRHKANSFPFMRLAFPAFICTNIYVRLHWNLLLILSRFANICRSEDFTAGVKKELSTKLYFTRASLFASLLPRERRKLLRRRALFTCWMKKKKASTKIKLWKRWTRGGTH